MRCVNLVENCEEEVTALHFLLFSAEPNPIHKSGHSVANEFPLLASYNRFFRWSEYFDQLSAFPYGLAVLAVIVCTRLKQKQFKQATVEANAVTVTE